MYIHLKSFFYSFGKGDKNKNNNKQTGHIHFHMSGVQVQKKKYTFCIVNFVFPPSCRSSLRVVVVYGLIETTVVDGCSSYMYEMKKKKNNNNSNNKYYIYNAKKKNP